MYVDLQSLPSLFIVLRRARVEIVSWRDEWVHGKSMSDWPRGSASATLKPEVLQERCAGSNPGGEPNERGAKWT